MLATSQNLANLDDACNVLHISCHGKNQDQHAMLFFEHGPDTHIPQGGWDKDVMVLGSEPRRLQRGSHLVLSEGLDGQFYQNAQVTRCTSTSHEQHTEH